MSARSLWSAVEDGVTEAVNEYMASRGLPPASAWHLQTRLADGLPWRLVQLVGQLGAEYEETEIPDAIKRYVEVLDGSEPITREMGDPPSSWMITLETTAVVDDIRITVWGVVEW